MSDDIFSLNVLGLDIGFTALTLVVLAAVIILVFVFVVFYFLPSLFLGWRLGSLTKELRKPERKDGSASVGELFRHPTLKWLWVEYEKTLHHQPGGDGPPRVFATTPAKAIFSEVVLVDTPLKVEFFKHLPGILTGIGIIGTFFTLIIGLEQFRVDLDPVLLQTQLQGLIKGVREAFLVSGLAIFSAILVTLFEKIRIHTLYHHVEDLAMALDSLYEGGVEEVYLSRLVAASEENAVQSRQLKDSMVNELKQMLENLVTRQIEASEQHYQILTNHLSRENERVAKSVSGALKESLEAPMSSISTAVGALGQQRGEQVHGLLQDLLTVFIDRLQGTLGQQMQDVSRMVTENAATMTMMRDQLQSLVGQLSSAGQSAQEQMARTLMETMTQAHQRQSEINQGIAVTLDQVRQTLERSQGESQERMAAAVDNFSNRFSRLTDEMQRRQEQNQEIGAKGLQSLIDAVHTLAQDIRHSGEAGAETSRNHLLNLLDESETRQQRLSEQVRGTLESLHSAFSNGQQKVQDSFLQTTTAIREEQQAAQTQTQTFIQSGVKVLMSNIKELIGSAQQTNQAMTSSIQKMEEVVTRTVGRLTEGANHVEGAARTFIQTSEGMTRTLQAQKDFQTRVERLATSVEQAATKLEVATTDQRSVQGQIIELTKQLKQIVEGQKVQETLSREMVTRMEGVTTRFRTAADEADKFTNGVGQVLGESFKQLDKNLKTTLDNQLRELDDKLASTLGHVEAHMGRFGEQVEGFSDLLDSLERQVNRKRN